MSLIQKHIKAIGVACILLIGALFYWSVLSYTRGRLSLPLDDSYIYFQFARNIVDGLPMQWSPGDGFSSAATSPLYPFILAAGYAAGLKGDLIILWALAIGLACLIASFFLMAALGRKLLPARAQPLAHWLAPLIFLLSGSQAWGYLSGMEIGLFSTSLLASLYYALDLLGGDRPAPGGSRWKLAAWGALLGILRPEGFFLVLMLAALLILRGLRARGTQGALRALPWLLMAAPAVAWLLVILGLTGHLAPSSMHQKSFLYDPDMTPYLVFSETFQNVLGILDNVYLRNHSPLFFVVFFVVGFFPRFLEELKRRDAGPFSLIFLWFFVGSFSTMMSTTSNDHHYRYQMPFFNLYILCGSLGLLAAFEAAGERMRVWAAGIIAFFILVLALNLPNWIDAYGLNSKNIRDQQTTIGAFIRETLPESAIIGLNDAGSIPYTSGRRCFDIVGLGTEGQSRWYRGGYGSMYEGFENLPAGRLPGYFAVYPRWWFNPDILKEKITEVILDNNTICGDAFLPLFKANWEILGKGHSPGLDHGKKLKIADRIDVADLDSESSHGYTGPRDTVYSAFTYGQGDRIGDGGRALLCGIDRESMNVSAHGGQDAKIIARIENSGSPAKLSVMVNGRLAADWSLQRAKGWQEPEADVPAGFFKEGKNVITVTCEGLGEVKSFHYWIMQ